MMNNKISDEEPPDEEQINLDLLKQAERIDLLKQAERIIEYARTHRGGFINFNRITMRTKS